MKTIFNEDREHFATLRLLFGKDFAEDARRKQGKELAQACDAMRDTIERRKLADRRTKERDKDRERRRQK